MAGAEPPKKAVFELKVDPLEHVPQPAQALAVRLPLPPVRV
jgi:hypothetical protein